MPVRRRAAGTPGPAHARVLGEPLEIEAGLRVLRFFEQRERRPDRRGVAQLRRGRDASLCESDVRAGVAFEASPIAAASAAADVSRSRRNSGSSPSRSRASEFAVVEATWNRRASSVAGSIGVVNGTIPVSGDTSPLSSGSERSSGVRSVSARTRGSRRLSSNQGSTGATRRPTRTPCSAARDRRCACSARPRRRSRALGTLPGSARRRRAGASAAGERHQTGEHQLDRQRRRVRRRRALHRPELGAYAMFDARR